MIPLSFTDMQVIVAAVMFLMGCMCVVLGTIVLISRGYSREVRAIATHTAKLGQKGAAHEITGLVHGAAELVASINALVRTASGIGVFLISLGLGLMFAAYWLIQQIEWTLL
jgi:hypothetical protein